MRISRILAIAGIGSALLLGSLAVPASAAVFPTRINVVQGIPGKTLDVCIDNKEVRSKAKYGSVTKADVVAGTHTIKLKKVAPGRCKGKTLRKFTFVIPDGIDATVVATHKSPSKWMLYYNPQSTSVDTSYYSFTNAADIGKVGITALFGGFTPSESAWIWQKGERRVPLTTNAGNTLHYAALKIGGSRFLGGQRVQNFAAGKHYDFILLGTSKKNTRWARVARKIQQVV